MEIMYLQNFYTHAKSVSPVIVQLVMPKSHKYLRQFRLLNDRMPDFPRLLNDCFGFYRS